MKVVGQISALVVMLVSSMQSQSQEPVLQYQSYATFAWQSYELEYLDSNANAAVSMQLPLLGLGASVSYGAWYMDVNAARSLKRSSKDGSLSPDVSSVLERDSTRSSYKLTAGYAFPSRVVVFLGYTQSDIEFDELSTTSADGGNTENRTQSNTQFQHDGPFAGAAYSYVLSDTHVVTFHSALGRFNGEVESNDRNIVESSSLSTTGLSFGLRSTFVLTERSDASLGVEWRKFDYSESGRGDLYSESILSLKAQWSYLF